MRQLSLTPLRIVLVAAVFAIAADAEAKGGRRGGGGSSKPVAAKPHDAGKEKDQGGFRPHITIRHPGGNSAAAAQPLAGKLVPIEPGAAMPERDEAEEQARRAEEQAARRRAAALQEAARKAAQEKAEAERLAALQKAEAEREARLAEERRVAAARQAAALEKKQREEAAIAADVDRVLQRAKADYPVLATPEGQPLLQRIQDRQQQLVARGLYPSIAMVEAVADHAHALAPRPSAVAPQPAAPAAAPQEQRTAFGSCRWVTPSKWSCK